MANSASTKPFYQAATVGDGRVIARAFGDSGTEIIVSDNGADWTPVSVPGGIAADFIDVSSPRWARRSGARGGPRRPLLLLRRRGRKLG